VVDGRAGLGNGRCLPAGPLRAPLEAQWPFTDALIVIGDGAAGARLANEARALSKPVFSARLEPDPNAAARLRGRRVLAFAGIGQPTKFYATLRLVGAEIVSMRSFADHHAYADAEILAIRQESTRLDAIPVTTEKDLVRIRDRSGIDVMPVSARLAEPEELRMLLAARLAD
jgi:tetraacyldisaccharide 4'-kinase